MEIQATQPRILDRKTAYSGANWFFWLAGLSVANSLLIYFFTVPNTPVAFGVTQWIDGTTGTMSAEGWRPPLTTVALAVNILIAAAFAGFGYLARRGSDTAFLLGIVFYVIDALLSLFLKDFYGFAFHFLGFFFLFRGLLASRHVRENATSY
ncbi:MAG TPA: hypothetical protein PKD26_15670 [Pyrinomonadaceae bacterium]|nr:hypothetical protein [Pyrinomonadaceae bacterium]